MEVMLTTMVQLSSCGGLNSSFSTREFARQRRSHASVELVELPAANTIGPDEHVISHRKMGKFTHLDMQKENRNNRFDTNVKKEKKIVGFCTISVPVIE